MQLHKWNPTKITNPNPNPNLNEATTTVEFSCRTDHRTHHDATAIWSTNYATNNNKNKKTK